MGEGELPWKGIYTGTLGREAKELGCCMEGAVG